jgi:protein-S-isoprenylcysteine O-methyltransferase Ste14
VDVLRVLINAMSLLWLLFEVWRTVREVGRTGSIADRSSRFVIAACLFASITLTLRFGDGRVWWMGHVRGFEILGLAIMAAGLGLRAWAVVTLGKFFTGTVMIQSDHRVVDNGPYHFLRHPSYTAAAMGLIGYALTTASAAALLAMTVGTVACLGYRIYVEERALFQGLGAAYREYAAKTKRVIPFVL